MREFLSASLLAAGALFAAPPSAPAQTNAAFAIYDPDPNHLWNRLFVTFYHQTYNVASNGTGSLLWAGPDVLDPPLSLHPRFMLEDVPFAKCNAVLDEFIDRQGAKLIRDPLKRAMLQRDFWSVFDVLARTRHSLPPFGPGGFPSTNRPAASAEHEQRRLLLAGKVARVLNELVLSRVEIENLPDTYRDAVDSKIFSARLDPQRDNVLPDDLFRPGSGWVEVVPTNGEGRLNHGTMISGRSLFRVFVKLPASSRAKIVSGTPLPIGTQFLLLREIICLDEYGQMVPTHVVESVQYRSSLRKPISSQSVARELKLNRALLFQGAQGGLKPAAATERDVIGYGSLGHFTLVDDRGDAGPMAALAPRCAGCHGDVSNRRLVTPGMISVPARSVGIDPIIDWRQKYAPLDALREFALSPTR